MESTCERNSCSSCREMAFLAAGRLRDRMRMRPVLGAGRSVRLIHGRRSVEYNLMADLRSAEEILRGIGRREGIVVDVRL
jgi:hypothetical protein